jgi:hypothetical protein
VVRGAVMNNKTRICRPQLAELLLRFGPFASRYCGMSQVTHWHIGSSSSSSGSSSGSSSSGSSGGSNMTHTGCWPEPMND